MLVEGVTRTSQIQGEGRYGPSLDVKGHICLLGGEKSLGPSLETSYHTDRLVLQQPELRHHRGRQGIRAALQMELETHLGACAWTEAMHLLKTPTLFPSSPPGRGESTGGQMCRCTFSGSYLSDSTIEISTGPNSFLSLLL